jgi:hypothetical protein
MNISFRDISGNQIAEMQSAGIIIRSARDAADIIAQLIEQKIDKLILHERNLAPDFWKISSGLASDILQKFADKNIDVAFVGEFDKRKSESLNAFIKEVNLKNHVLFTNDIELAQNSFSRK